MLAQFFVILASLLCVASDIAARNGRGQIPDPPNSDCAVLEEQFGIKREDIRLPHEYDCTRFYECDDRTLIEKHCADRYQTRYDPFQKLCDWNSKTKCLNYAEYLEIVGRIAADEM